MTALLFQGFYLLSCLGMLPDERSIVSCDVGDLNTNANTDVMSADEADGRGDDAYDQKS